VMGGRIEQRQWRLAGLQQSDGWMTGGRITSEICVVDHRHVLSDGGLGKDDDKREHQSLDPVHPLPHLPPMLKRIGLCFVLLAACKNSTGPDQNLTGSWAGTFATTTPPGPSLLWSATLTQSATLVTGTFTCNGTESYTVDGTNLHNSLNLRLVGTFGDTASWTGMAGYNIGVLANGQFSDNDGAACLSGTGIWQGRIQ